MASGMVQVQAIMELCVQQERKMQKDLTLTGVAAVGVAAVGPKAAARKQFSSFLLSKIRKWKHMQMTCRHSPIGRSQFHADNAVGAALSSLVLTSC